EANVATSPGIGFGEHGEDHLRLALVENRHRLRQAVRNIKTFLNRRGAGRSRSQARAVA
ncbi:MAG: aminotransferase, partial [Geminicoccaceae bacterium]